VCDCLVICRLVFMGKCLKEVPDSEFPIQGNIDLTFPPLALFLT
jgi:hypothetical protein